MNTDFDIKAFKEQAAHDYAVRYGKDGFYFVYFNYDGFYTVLSTILLRVLFKTGYKKFANKGKFLPTTIKDYIKYVYGKKFVVGREYFVRAYEETDQSGNPVLDIRIESEEESVQNVINQMNRNIELHLKRWKGKLLAEKLFQDLASKCRFK